MDNENKSWPKDLTQPHPSINPNKHRRARYLTAAFGLLLVTGFGFIGGYFGSYARDDMSNVDTSDTSQQQQIVSSESQLIADIANRVGKSVVSVNVTSSQPSLFGFYGSSQIQKSAGTGIIISDDGIIMTNRHVVPASAQTVNVTLYDGTVFENVEVIGRTNDNDNLDIAFLKIKDLGETKLNVASLGDSSKASVGDRVVAIGNALGQFQNTVTSGIISGFGRSIQATGGNNDSETLLHLIQTDAAINSGNSGGPLVNINGEVIGINTAIANDSQNIGFAIPINDVEGLIKQVLETGSFKRAYLGVRYIQLDSTIAKKLDIQQTIGAYIPTPQQSNGSNSVISGSPADKAGIKPGDIILKINDTTLDADNDLSSVIDQLSVGDEIKLQVLRDGKTIELKATLADSTN